jgi:hypothetical protein
MITSWLRATGLVDTKNVVLVSPAATVTVAGTVARPVSLLESARVTPPSGAALTSATVPVDVSPPSTYEGSTTTDLSGDD